MANEAQIINNPDSTPGAVSTGYQLQNTGMVSQRVGIDKTVVEGGTGECVLKISGPVDVNGVMYTIQSEVTFTLTTAGKYFIHLATGGTGTLTPTIGTGANTFDDDKNARYTDTGTFRVLNWVIYYDGTTAYVHRLITPESTKTNLYDLDEPEETYISTTATAWTAKRSKYYKIILVAQGYRIFINSGDIWTFITDGSGILTFSDGVTTLSGFSGGDYIGPSYGFAALITG